MVPPNSRSGASARPAPPDLPALLALLGGLLAWAGWFIWRTSFVLDGGRVFCLFDDAMISMTYARNLVSGYGLNWARQGAPVEGFTHPLWTALMVPVNLLPIALERRSLVVQVLSLALLMLNVVLVRRLMRRHFSLPGARHWVPACVLTAFYYPLDYWALIGMETGLQVVLVTASVLLAFEIVYARRDRHLALLTVGTLAVLLRLDMAPLVAAVQLFVLAHGGLRRAGEPGGRAALRHWLAGVAVLVAAVAGYGLFRWSYFHDLLPNTYYLKLAGVPLAVRLLRGGGALLDTLVAQGPLLPVLAIGLVALLLEGRRQPPAEPGTAWGGKLLLPLALLVICCAYSVYVGGDAWEGEQVRANRFLAFAMPQLFVVFNALLNRLPRLSRLGVAAATVAALLAANDLWRVEEAQKGWRNFLSISRPLATDAHRGVAGRVRELQRIADPTARVAVIWAGIPAYFSDWRLIDQLGYNDRHIARVRPNRGLTEDRFEDFSPGHVKEDTLYVLEIQRPDAYFQTLRGKALAPRLLARGYRNVGGFWVKADSPRVHLPPGALAAASAAIPSSNPSPSAFPFSIKPAAGAESIYDAPR